jgi:hypothetical protein
MWLEIGEVCDIVLSTRDAAGSNIAVAPQAR